ncbi:MAG: YHYH domain-containing protein [Thermodesulfobacteriota bacterium]
MFLKSAVRKITIVILLTFLVSLFILTFSRYSFSHGGGLDAYGCHYNRKVGGYHCHRGQFAGQSFSSKEEMLQKLREQERTETPKPSEEPSKSTTSDN